MLRTSLLLLALLVVEQCAADFDICKNGTKTKCHNKKGECQLQDTHCPGIVWKGRQFCEDFENCICCGDCSKGTKNPCKALNGTCISQDELCDGKTVTHKAFCKEHKNCKCCFPCDMECESVNNLCTSYGDFGKDFCVEKSPDHCPKRHAKVYDICYKKTANLDNVPCDCCKYLGCTSNGDACTGKEDFCIEFDKSCPEGYDTSKDCHKPVIINGTWIKSELCKCCKPSPVDPACKSVNNLCTSYGDFGRDFCVEKADHCPKGHDKVYDICYKEFMGSKLPCDCCKYSGCTSNGDACTGKEDFCIEFDKSCPQGYDTSKDCHKPVIVNGTWTQSKICKCCKPFQIEKELHG